MGCGERSSRCPTHTPSPSTASARAICRPSPRSTTRPPASARRSASTCTARRAARPATSWRRSSPAGRGHELRARQVQPQHEWLRPDRRRRLGERAGQSVSAGQDDRHRHQRRRHGHHDQRGAVYVGTKQATGTEVDKAGLTNGTLKFINVTGNPVEIVNTTTRATNITSGTRFTLSGTSSTTFSRPEDGAVEPAQPEPVLLRHDRPARSGQRRRRRADRPDPAVEAHLRRHHEPEPRRQDRSADQRPHRRRREGEHVRQHRRQREDRPARPAGGRRQRRAQRQSCGSTIRPPTRSCGSRITTRPGLAASACAATVPFNQDEEASGVIDVSSILGAGVYRQRGPGALCHQRGNPRGFTNPDELVEGGQLLAMRIPFPVGDEEGSVQGRRLGVDLPGRRHDLQEPGRLRSVTRTPASSHRRQGHRVLQSNTRCLQSAWSAPVSRVNDIHTHPTLPRSTRFVLRVQF